MQCGIIINVLTDILKTLLYVAVGHIMKNGNELITAVPSDKVLRRNRFSKLDGKGTDIFITLIMTEIIVDAAQIIQIKNADSNGRSSIHSIWCI